MKLKYIIIAIILTIGCGDADINTLSTEICSCFELKEKQFSKLDDEEKFKVIKNCFNDKINNKAAYLNNEYMKNSDRSKLIDFTYEVSFNTNIRLSKNCNFYKNNKDEIRQILGRKADYRKKKPSNNTKKSLSISGKIVNIENLEYNSCNFFLTDNQGNKMKFFYKSIPVSYLNKQVKVSYEKAVMDADTVLFVHKIDLE